MIETGWVSILPPLIAIVLALVTKEVYSSLFLGVLSGMVIYVVSAQEPFMAVFSRIFDMMAQKIADNAYMIIFLALLWAVITLVGKSGGTAAYGRWAEKRLKNKRATLLTTALLGILIFIDDGFNCLTIGTVMRPVYDRQRISREKLAYIIDATAAPICIIAPVSSWAVAVASEVSDTNGFQTFLSTVPYNLYALLTIMMVAFVCITGLDFGKMRKAEEKAQLEGNGDTMTEEKDDTQESKGRVIDLVLPILVLIVCAILGMAYVGGFFSGTPFSEAIGANPTAGLSLGAFAGLVTAFILYIPRKIMKPRQFAGNIVSGIGSIVPPMLILILSWTLGGVCRELIGTGEFISGFIASSNVPLQLLPFVVFVIAALMSFSMGTSWGTFGLLIPIVTMICSATAGSELLVPTLGATLAGSVYGDHCSPISDTTILASTGAQCEHIRHVETQIPYATLTAVVCAVGYLIIGFTNMPWIGLGVSAALLIGAMLILRKVYRPKEA
ncbi:Na+/H+ antiporter NhaC family protein [Ruminococcus difficilis]|uniref:Na+/H+ antiporter NhaC family protein n=1 Tax=Ruminococcus difficilis TaxID=2763069 RepID=A0A934TZ13_9FIRM|nr:Na+/H+ antiporter NhaC family protein [Ruminococcus difficilis]MBK6088471.1 Na+/H+ antiporter NhaC family protein [Ruminococcus difficilis]